MKKIVLFLFNFILIFSLTSCGKSNSTSTLTIDEPSITITTPSDDNQTTKEEETDNMKLTLKIDDIEVDVIWADNDSVEALKNLAKNGLTINMSKYGGFEQVGSIGSTLPSDDTRITTIPGDVVLYSSNQIVIFYDSSTWSYTKLGHINLSKSELDDLLGNEDVVIFLGVKS
ncbi:cyclophilin-like fold protein [Mycoplasmopsis arginini]|uniref:cyclophilin-like fold protein n=1 Tax=Mycoplasmopsis arginini TaxID=2094 RepID=UPI0035142332